MLILVAISLYLTVLDHFSPAFDELDFQTHRRGRTTSTNSASSASDESLLLCIGDDDPEDTSVAAAARRFFLRCFVCFVLFCTSANCRDGILISQD